MFSKAERDYLSGKFTPNPNYRRFLNHKIKKKLRGFYQLDFPLIQNSSVSDFANGVSELDNIVKRARSDLNRRPNAPQAFALSKLCNESNKFWLSNF